jgi:hypothetical protein
MVQIIQVLGPAGGAFITTQRTDSDVEQPNRARASFQESSNPGIPGRLKGDAVNLIVEINPVWRTAELNDDTRIKQFIRCFHFGNLVIPKNFKRLEKAGGIGPRAFVKEINIARETRVSMKDDGLAANNEVTDFKSPQESDEFDDVSRKPGRG